MNPNTRPDTMRAQPGILNVGGPPFMQGLPPSSQQQLGPNHLGLPASNTNASNILLNNATANLSPAQQQRYQASLQQDIRQRQMQQMRQTNQHMMGSTGTSLSSNSGAPPHMATLPHNQNMPFNSNMIPQGSGNNLRRVSSQPSMNQGSGPISGMPVNASLAMNSSANLTQSQMRQIPQQIQHQIRLQSQQQHSNQMTPDMAMAINRQAVNSGIPTSRGGSSQALMNSLSQPGSLPHQMGIHQNQFQNSVQMHSQHPQPPIPSPRAGSHAPGLSMPTAGPSQTSVNRPQTNTEDNSMPFLNFPNTQFPQSHNASRIPKTNGQFPAFVQTSRSPIPLTDMPQTMSANIGASSSNPSRPGFHLTPAQQFEQMNTSSENFPVHFPMHPHVPQRPPSHNTAHHPLPQHAIRQSPPRPPDSHMASHPQRPNSQPQAIPQPPSAQQGHAPRSAHPPIPPGVQQTAGNRMMMQQHGSQQPGQQMGIQGLSQPLPMVHRQPQTSQPQHSSAGHSGGPPPSIADVPSDAAPPTHPAQRLQNHAPSLGSGQGISRLLQFSSCLSSEHQRKAQLPYWDDLISEYFSKKALLKFTFWKDSQRTEAKLFDFDVTILPRFFLVTTQSGVKSMTLALEGARERLCSPGHSIIECVSATWTYKYVNGYTVVLRGPLTAQVAVGNGPYGNSQSAAAMHMSALRFEDFQFEAGSHEKSIALESIMGTRLPLESKINLQSTPSSPMPISGSGPVPELTKHSRVEEESRVFIEGASIPAEPVNAFGIPQATMRCLELEESVAQMGDLFVFVKETSLGPLEALRRYAAKIKEQHPINPLPPIPGPNQVNGIHSHSGNSTNNTFSNVPSTQPVTLYSSAPPSVTNPNSNTAMTPITSPEHAPASAGNSPQKQHKTIPSQQQLPSSQQSQQAPQSQPPPHATPSSSGTIDTPPTVSSGTASNTPALPSAPLKRKQTTDATSPVPVINEPSQKRPTRKRRITNAGGNSG